MTMPQVSATLPKNLIQEIDDLANNSERTRSDMISVLLQSAVKERNRKRVKNLSPVQHNTSDPR